MSAQILNKKIELIQWLSNLEDESLIEKLIELRNKQHKQPVKKISTAEKTSIKKGIKQANNKELKSHSEARKIYEKWL